MSFPSRILLILALAVAATATVHAQTRELSSSGQLLDGVAAVVNDGVVLKSELQDELTRIIERLQQQGTPIPPMQQLAPQVLERLIVQRIQLQRADRVGLQVSDETLNAALANVAARNNVSLGELPGLLAQEGVDYGSYRENLRNQIVTDQLRQRDVLGRINVSPKEIEEYLDREQDREFFSEEFQLSQILVATSTGSSPAPSTRGSSLRGSSRLLINIARALAPSSKRPNSVIVRTSSTIEARA